MNEKAHETIERTGDFPTDTSGLPRAVAPSGILSVGPGIEPL